MLLEELVGSLYEDFCINHVSCINIILIMDIRSVGEAPEVARCGTWW